MTRRLLLTLPLAAAYLRADAEKDVERLLASAASGLSAGRPEVFLEAFDHSLAGFGRLHADVVALLEGSAVSCSIDVKSNTGDESERALTLEWLLHLNPKGDNPSSSERVKTVKCRVRKVGKNWRIVEFEPLDLFAPASR